MAIAKVERKSDDYTQLMTRYNCAAGDWENWQSLYMEAYDYTFPNKDPYDEEFDDTPGVRKNLQVYDSTGPIAARQLVSKLHANLVPPSLQWFSLEPSDLIQDTEQRKQLQEFLQVLTSIIYSAFNGSNWDLAINEGFHDLIIGTMALQIFATNDEKNPIVFKCCPIDRLAPEQDAFDNIKTVWRSFDKVHHQDVERLWPGARITDQMRIRIEQDSQARFDFIEGVIFDPVKDDYRVVVMSREEPEFIIDKPSKSSPWVVGRWSKSAREIGGRGPAIEALPTVRTVNMMAKFLMAAAALNATPPWLGFSDGIFNPNNYVIKPNDIIPISPESSMNLPLRKLDVSGDVSFGELTMNDLRSQINQIFYVSPTRPVQSPSQTATEIMIRQQQFLEEIAPAFSRIEVEILPKIINRVMFILQEKGLLPSDMNADRYKGMFQVRFKSPLEQSQQLQEVQKLLQYDQAIAQIVGNEGKLMGYDLTKIPTYLATQFDIDLDLIKSPKQIEEDINAAQAAAQQDANQNQAPDAVETTAKASTSEEMGVDE